MSFKAVKELRTTGKLEEALAMAIADLLILGSPPQTEGPAAPAAGRQRTG